jgi:hypothetical protein
MRVIRTEDQDLIEFEDSEELDRLVRSFVSVRRCLPHGGRTPIVIGLGEGCRVQIVRTIRVEVEGLRT